MIKKVVKRFPIPRMYLEVIKAANAKRIPTP